MCSLIHVYKVFDSFRALFFMMPRLVKTCSKCNLNKCLSCGTKLTKSENVRGRPVGTTVAAGYRGYRVGPGCRKGTTIAAGYNANSGRLLGITVATGHVGM